MSSSSLLPWESFKELFSIDYQSVESEVQDLPGHYKDLDPRALYTSHQDLHGIMTSSFVQGTWVDLGAGVGESALMYGLLYPERRALGVEVDHSRVRAGTVIKERLELANVDIIQGDLSHCSIPDGDTYFLYFPTGPVLDRILHELRAKKEFKRLIAIESHGDFFSRIEKENWLLPIGSIPLHTPRHHGEARIWERTEASVVEGPHQLSFRESYLLIEEDGGAQWLGDSLGLEWLQDDLYQLVHPPRAFRWKQVVKVLERNELSHELCELVELRKSGKHGIRKIYLAPKFMVELANGSVTFPMAQKFPF